MRNFIKNRLFAIKKDELKKFIPIFLIGNLVVFNFVMLKQLKDSHLLASLGVSAIPRAKIFFVFPLSFIFMFAYNKLSNYMTARNIFSVFVGFFGLCFFAYAVMPETNNRIIAYLFVAISESWSTVVFGTCMWAFFNDICTVDEAKRFYVLVSGVQLGAILASGSSRWFVRAFGTNFSNVILLLISFFCLLIILMVYGFSKQLPDIRSDVTEPKKTKSESGIFEGMKLVFTSRYLFLILVLTIAYNFTIVVTEFIWNASIKKHYTTKAAIFVFRSSVIFWTNIVASIFSVFLSGGLINYVGIGTALMLFPIVSGLSTTVYFWLFMTPLTGAVQWMLVKVSKYALSDPAKQTLFIPTTKEERYKAKSVIDMVGARGGKAAASLFTLAALNPIIEYGVKNGLNPSKVLQSISSLSYPILMGITLIWLLSAIYISRLFLKYRSKSEEV